MKGLVALTCLALCGGLVPAAGQVASTYRIKPSDVVLPPEVKLGDYQRTIRPFDNWTLICDENLKARKKVCNVSQIIETRPARWPSAGRLPPPRTASRT